MNKMTKSHNPLLMAAAGQLSIEQNVGGEPNREFRKSLAASIESSVTSSRKVRRRRKALDKNFVVKLKKPKGAIPQEVLNERKKALEIYSEIRDIFPGYGRLGSHSRRLGKNIIQVPGTGEADFPYPSPRELKAGAKKHLDVWMDEVNAAIALQEALGAQSSESGESAAQNAETVLGEAVSFDRNLGATLFEQTVGVESKLADGKFEAALNRRFEFPRAQLRWVLDLGRNIEELKACLEAAGDNKELKQKILALHAEALDDFNRLGKFHPAANSLLDQLETANALYRQVLPDLLKVLEGMYPQLPEEQLIEVAAQAIDQELMIILYVLWVWGDIFSQDRNRLFVKERASIDEFINGCFELFIGTDCGSCGKTCRDLLSTMSAGGVFKCHFEAEGPSTLPAQVMQARGPSGNASAHAINIPFDMEKMIAFVKVLFAHEFMHDIFSDVRGLEQELDEVIENVLITAYNKKDGERGKLRLTSETIKVGDQDVPTIALLLQVFRDTLNEMNADVSGGILLTGPAFLECMIVTFKALYGPILKRYGRDNKFPNDTIYVADGKGHIEMEAHLPPYIRAKIVRFALEYLGFKKEAKMFSERTDQATELDARPAVATWWDVEGNYPNIDIPCADLEAAGRIVVKAIMNTKLKSLKGRSMKQLLSWTRGRQDKVDAFVKIMTGEATMDDLPTGKIYETFVAAAVPLADRRLVEMGKTGRKALEHLQVVEPALHDIAVKRHREQREAKSCHPKGA